MVFIGRYVSNNDDEVLLKACSLCKKQDIKFIWIGLNDATMEIVTRKCETYDIAKKFKLEKLMSPHELRKYLIRNASVGIAAYKSGYRSEVVTSPTKIFDYFSVGLPVIAAKMPTTQSIMTEGEEGYFYKPGDAESLAESIKTMFSDKAYYQEMHENALIAAGEFSYIKRAEKLISFIRSIG